MKTRENIENRLSVIIGDLNELLFDMEENGGRRPDFSPWEYNGIITAVEKLNDIALSLNDE